jgi:mRNA interferase MazF
MSETFWHACEAGQCDERGVATSGPSPTAKDYAGTRQRRPVVVVVQDDSFDVTGSITICAFTTDQTNAPLFRLPLEPNERNGLRAACRLMVDEITTVPKSKVGSHVGRLDDEDILRLNRVTDSCPRCGITVKLDGQASDASPTPSSGAAKWMLSSK